MQKHLATQLHYDFRLEHNGVLLSWAVPKGPSLDSTVKRLAMQVEDHPVEYGTFEGVIPEGYGAGVVMLWDQGTWTPESEDVDAALAKGDLKIQLNGYKLKGSWVLVRTRGWGGSRASGGGGGEAGSGRSWLLIKHKDDWSGPIDITTFAPLSVKSEGNFRDILMQEAPGVWHSNRAVPGKFGDAALTKIVEKVLAQEESESAAKDDAGAAPAKAPAKAARAKAAPREAASADDADHEAGSATPAKPRAASKRTAKTPDTAPPPRKRAAPRAAKKR
jgi:bifunctional non-homologous end joining protein LigD